ncbi:MAG: hypothetical protein WBG02_11100 [Candidatus Acidiferrum sp.]
MRKPKNRTRVFLNLPYDSPFQNPYLAYICGIQAFGMEPHVTLEIPGGERGLDRIIELIQSCEYSVHDLSRVELNPLPPRTPRFNMPFELGLAVMWEKMAKSRHMWFVMETIPYRLAKSLSDLNGTDPYIHGGTIQGVFRELCSAFVRPGQQPSVPEMWRIYRAVRERVPTILRDCGTRSIFQARTFYEISVAASAAARGIVGRT